MATIWTTTTVPADLNDKTDGRERDAGTTLKGGLVIRVVDMLPNASSPFHRTNSIDYGIVMSGKIELELDNQVFITVAAGGSLFNVVQFINGETQVVKRFVESSLS